MHGLQIPLHTGLTAIDGAEEFVQRLQTTEFSELKKNRRVGPLLLAAPLQVLPPNSDACTGVDSPPRPLASPLPPPS